MGARLSKVSTHVVLKEDRGKMVSLKKQENGGCGVVGSKRESRVGFRTIIGDRSTKSGPAAGGGRRAGSKVNQ